MAAYAQKTVKQLQKELESRQLATNGIKKDLVARLETDDAEKGEEKPAGSKEEIPEVQEEPAKEEDKEAPVPEAKPESPAVAPAESAAVADTVTDVKPAEPESKPFSPEEAKTKALEHLQVKLRRAQKFADDQTTIDSLQRQIARIQKFGLDQTTQLARELGLGQGPQNTIARHNKKKTSHKGTKNKR
ncbi:LANO_0B07030g1_1 [Lachancea nothofagi CBS 11611]|uniref:LANO_0B07030g1_1 n=1 Tax=Lachancea nothofagi CBS 11611 TaxID=1266666 RepID=A0A1G4IZP1_9SACH|nr:LANO_0B07030g1_1 [Lachancea nothofagi CBS 11611]